MLSERYKKKLKKLGVSALFHLSNRYSDIVVASFGRAGSTLVHKALIEGMAQARFGARQDPVFRSRLSRGAFDGPRVKLKPGFVYKTHEYPGNLQRSSKTRAVFLFGSPLEAALSVRNQFDTEGENWVRAHFRNLGRPYRYEDLLQEDVLGFRDQCLAWMTFTDMPVLCLRYEAIWENAERLSEFCGFPVPLPERRARSQKLVDPSALAQAKATYGQLEEDLARLPDCFLADPKYRALLSEDAKEGN